jgi:hypothetical protein
LCDAIALTAPGVPVVAAGALEEKLADLLAPQRLDVLSPGLLLRLGSSLPSWVPAAGLLMMGSGLLAALISARRILRIDPAVSLRAE